MAKNKFQLLVFLAGEALILMVGVLFNLAAIILKSVFRIHKRKPGIDNFDDVFHFHVW